MLTTIVGRFFRFVSPLPAVQIRHLQMSTHTVPVEKVESWDSYYTTSKDTLQKILTDHGSDPTIGPYEVKPILNSKVSIWEGNITSLAIDAIVNAANNSLLGGGGVDGAIHAAAGPELKAECSGLQGCDTGDAKITKGYKLPAKFVIHTVGPRGEKKGPLESCYNRSLDLLVSHNLRSIAFPCISTGIYGYPQEAAAKVAISTTRKFLEKHHESVDRVIFCLFLKKDVEIYKTLMQQIFPAE